jgi:inhibitor of cysteine peptidase
MRELTLTAEDDGCVVSVRAGSHVTIRLPENPTTGYRWSIAYRSDQLVLAESRFDPPAGKGPGAGGTRVVRLHAEAPGAARVALSYSRSWQHRAEATREFRIIILP